MIRFSHIFDEFWKFKEGTRKGRYIFMFHKNKFTMIRVKMVLNQPVFLFFFQRVVSPGGCWRWTPPWCYELWMLVNITCYINSLWPSDAIWWHRSGPTLAQVMACCLTAPSHYLNQCWLIISEVLWHSHKGNSIGNAEVIYHSCQFENFKFKIAVRSPRGQWDNSQYSI